MRRIKLDRSKDTLGKAARHLVLVGHIGQIAGYQRGEAPSHPHSHERGRNGVGVERRQDALVVGSRGGDIGHRRRQIRHHHGAGKPPRRIGQHLRQHGSVAQMDMPVIGAAQADRVHSLGHLFTHISIERRGPACYGPRSALLEGAVMSGCIVGWAHSKFGKHEGRDIEQLIVEVTQAALADAGVSAVDIDTVYLGTMNGGFVRQEFPASLVFQADPGFRFKPATRVEDACATGSAAIHQGLNAIAAGKARLALVVGVEKMTEVSGAQVGDILLGASYRKEEDAIEGGFAGIFGQIAQSYFQRYGDQSDALARIAAKNHKNGVANPLAQMQKDLGYEFCRTVSDKNPIVAGPLKRTDCSLVSDGAAAVVLADTATALSLKKAVVFRAAEQVNDFLPMSRRDVIAFEGPALAWKKALAAARLGLDDLDLVETHDCFTIAELIEYEAMGLTAKGEDRKSTRLNS